MSADVSLFAVRKSDNAPLERFWLGGNGVRALLAAQTPLESRTFMDVIPVKAKLAKQFLEANDQEFYAGNLATRALKFLDADRGREYAYFFVIE